MSRRAWKSYLQFSRTESVGVAALCILILVLLCARFTMEWWARPQPAIEEDRQLIAAWDKFKERQAVLTASASASASARARARAEAGADALPPVTLFPFDPNTIDSMDGLRLGLRPVTVRMLINWRRKGKVFYRKEDLKPLYTLQEHEYQRLEPWIRITARKETIAEHEPLPSLPETIDLNTVDSATLVRLEGIGPVLAHRIIQRREALGGFVRHEQLKEVYRFEDSVFIRLRERLQLNRGKVKKIALNTCTIEDLRMHPYVGEKLAEYIVRYREGLGGFTDVSQLRQVPLMTEEQYRKLAEYCRLGD